MKTNFGTGGREVGWSIIQHDVASTPWPLLPDASVQCIVTSPPYWSLRDYGMPGQIGLESTIDEYVEKMVGVFREARRVLRDDGVLWLNLGDSFASGKGTCQNPGGGGHSLGAKRKEMGVHPLDRGNVSTLRAQGLKPKDLVGMPWRVAFALQADGWWLRSDIVWSKPNPMPESISDRPTRAHEYVFLMTKSARYFYDADAIRQPLTEGSMLRMKQPTFDTQGGGPKDPLEGNRSQRKALENMRHNTARRTSQESANRVWTDPDAMARIAAQGANARSVWSISTEPFPGAHFATFPTELARRCVLAGSKPGDLVLDPFCGSGTTLLVSDIAGRKSVGLELNPEYIKIARDRLLAPRTEDEAERREMEDAGQTSLFEEIGE